MKNTTKNKTISHLKSTTALALLATLGFCVMNTTFSNIAQADPTHAEENNKDCKTNESKDKKCEEKNSFQLFIQSLMHRFFGSEDQNSAVHSEDKTGGGGGGGTTPAAPSESTQSPQSETPSGETGTTGSGSSSEGSEGTQNNPPTENSIMNEPTGTGIYMLQEPLQPEPGPQTDDSTGGNTPETLTAPPTTETPTGSDSSMTGGTIIKDKPTKTPPPTPDVIIKTPQATEPVTTPAPTTLPPKDQTSVTPPVSTQTPPKPPKEPLISGTAGSGTPTEGTQTQGTQSLPQAVIVQPQVITATPFATFTPTTPAAPSSSAPLDLNSGVVIHQNNQQVFLPSDPYKDVPLGGSKTETTDLPTTNTHALANLFSTFKEANPNQSGGTQTFPQAIILQPQVLTALPYSTFTPTPNPEPIEAERLTLEEGGQTTLILDRNDSTSAPPAANTTTYVGGAPAAGNPQAPSGTTMPLLDLSNASPTVTNGQLTINDTTVDQQPSNLADWAAAMGQFNGTVAGGSTTTTETTILMFSGGAVTTTFSTPSNPASFVVNGTSSTTFGTGSFAASNTLYNSSGQHIGIVTNAMPQILSTSQTYKGFVYDSSGNVIGAFINGLYFAYADGKWYQAVLGKVPVQYVNADPAIITRFFGTVPGTQIVTQERQTSTPVKQSKPSTPKKATKTTDDTTDIVYIDEDSGSPERNSLRDQGRPSPASTAPPVPVAPVAPPPEPDDNF